MISEALRPFWRIPLVALLAAVLAFAASFIVYPTYESSTRLLVHGRNATFLTSTGEDLTGQPGVIDSTLSQALLSTYAGIATSRSVATAVVDKLEVHKQPASTSPYAPITQALAWVYRCGRAFVTAGFCAPVDPYEAAILDVQNGISAEPSGTNGGNSAGQPGSYVLEVRASGGSAVQAQAITDAVADELVSLSNDRFERDAAKNIDNLQAQVDRAAKESKAKTLAVADFQTENEISSADVKQSLSAATAEKVRSDLLKARADLADVEAQLASLDRSLSQVPRDQRSTQKIVTGRSTTETETDSTNTVYSEMLIKLNTLKAEEAGLSARVDRLEGQISRAKPLANNGPMAELQVLQSSADLASANLQTLTTTLQQAQSSAAQGSVDLSRLDPASQPTCPAKPKRYIYLALGLLVGGLAGAALTAQAQRRNPRLLTAEEREAELDGSLTGDDPRQTLVIPTPAPAAGNAVRPVVAATPAPLDDDTRELAPVNRVDLLLSGSRNKPR